MTEYPKQPRIHLINSSNGYCSEIRQKSTGKNDQNHNKTICWKCHGFVMVFSENPAENPYFS